MGSRHRVTYADRAASAEVPLDSAAAPGALLASLDLSEAFRFSLPPRAAVYSLAYFSSASLARFFRSSSGSSTPASVPLRRTLEAGPMRRSALFQ